jgi:sugar/nucleoside kinase (ribokinase family)
LTDYLGLDEEPSRRVGVVHAVGNALATFLYARSWQARRRGHHSAGVAFGWAGATAATAAAYLGGHLAFGSTPE